MTRLLWCLAALAVQAGASRTTDVEQELWENASLRVYRPHCEGLRICNGAPDEAGQTASYGADNKGKVRVATAKSCCYGGLRHSIKLYSPRLPTDWGCRGQTDPAIQAAVKNNVPIKLTRGIV